MPAEVGNALFRYIMEERHSKADRNIFLSEKAPHKPVGRSVCGSADLHGIKEGEETGTEDRFSD